MERAQSRVILPELPDHLIKEIVALMPFPRIFIVCYLSKAWRARLTPEKSLKDDGDKQLATSFQKLLGKVNNWGSFYLIFYTSVEGDMNYCAYDCTSYTNQVVLPSLSFISKELGSDSIMCVDGPLVVLTLKVLVKTSEEMHDEEGAQGVGEQEVDRQEVAKETTQETSMMYVTNICTGSWKKLPPRPNVRAMFCRYPKLVCDKRSETYKVICAIAEGKDPNSVVRFDRISIQVYDSKTETWRTKELAPFYAFSTKVEYINGIVYTLAFYRDPMVDLRLGVLVFNIEEWKIDKFPLQDADEIYWALQTHALAMVAYNGQLFVTSQREIIVLR